uniref:Serine/threonine-protein phosphatase with EF-hands n=1 Tax=Haplochromis burtoni TaxID=8153 RepID=A0A3Q2V4R5_HAPBU
MGCGVTKAAILIQRWYRQYVARTEMRRRYTWNIFQSIEYSGEQAQIKLYNFLGYLMDNFTPSSNERNLISHIFRENEVCRDAEWERYFCYKNIEVPEIYSGPHLTFPLTVEEAVGLVEAFRNKKQQLHSRYVLQLLLETWKLLRMFPNINRISTCHSKEITICGMIKIFFDSGGKNGMPSLEKPYVFNGDFVDRGRDSIEILLILFAFLLVYPSNVYLNRGNHEDHIVNLRYGFTKEVLNKYKMHGKRILKLLQKIFSWLPLATVIDQKVLVLHGGISDSTDLGVLARVDRHIVRNQHVMSKAVIYSSLSLQSISRVFQRRASFTYPKPMGTRYCFQNRSLQDFSDRIRVNMENQLELSRREEPTLNTQINKPEQESLCLSTDSVSSDNTVDEWKQILDLLWSDPMTQDGCIPNEVRGGGCYWGPDVTEDFLNRHNLQLIIRSHECKQEGYEFCHNRKVTSVFPSSSVTGFNRGAYVKLGPDLVPYLIQYQASSMTRELTVRQSVGRTERSALRVLREQLFAHKSDLLCAFRKFDSENKGLLSLNDWASAVESVMHLDLPWRMLRSQLVTCKNSEGTIDYYEWFNELTFFFWSLQHIDQSLLEMLYRHRSTLETIFRIVDTDNSGFISMQDFRQTWKLLSVYLKMEITDEAISDLAVTIDSNHDGSIDIDEFMEAFRLTDKKSRLERGRSMFMGTRSGCLTANAHLKRRKSGQNAAA